MTHPALFRTSSVVSAEATHDALGRCYSPERLACALVDALECQTPGSAIEPSVGGGAFVRALRRRWPAVHITGVDIDREAEGLAVVDYPLVGDWPVLSDYITGGDPVDVNVGNPPFGQSVGMAVTIAHVLASIRSARTCLQVLPAAYVSGVEFARVLDAHPPAVVHRVVGRPWPARLREVLAFEWREGWTGPTELRLLAGWP